MEKSNSVYLNDGVYLSDDGWQLWLAVNHHENKVIALDMTTLTLLMKHMTRIVPVTHLITMHQLEIARLQELQVDALKAGEGDE